MRRAEELPLAWRGEEQERGLDALADHGEEHERENAPGHAAVRQRLLDTALQLALEIPRLAEHPEDHPGEETGGEEHRDALEDLLGRALEFRVQGDEDREEADAHGRSRSGAEPDPAMGAARADLGEVRQDDAGDDRHLDALAQGDDQCAQVTRRHLLCSRCDTRSRRIR